MINVSEANAIATIALTDCRALSVHDLAFGLGGEAPGLDDDRLGFGEQAGRQF